MIDPVPPRTHPDSARAAEKGFIQLNGDPINPHEPLPEEIFTTEGEPVNSYGILLSMIKKAHSPGPVELFDEDEKPVDPNHPHTDELYDESGTPVDWFGKVMPERFY